MAAHRIELNVGVPRIFQQKPLFMSTVVYSVVNLLTKPVNLHCHETTLYKRFGLKDIHMPYVLNTFCIIIIAIIINHTLLQPHISLNKTW